MLIEVKAIAKIEEFLQMEQVYENPGKKPIMHVGLCLNYAYHGRIRVRVKGRYCKNKNPDSVLNSYFNCFKSLVMLIVPEEKTGGYFLVVPPKDIKLSQIIRQFGGLGFAPEDKN